MHICMFLRVFVCSRVYVRFVNFELCKSTLVSNFATLVFFAHVEGKTYCM